MVIKERAVEWFCNQCTKCRYYAGIANEKPCILEDPCMSEEEFKTVRAGLERKDEQA